MIGTCSARAAIAGNPSDGYGGAVVAIPLTAVSAVVEVERADRFEIQHAPSADDTFATFDELVEQVDTVGYGDARQLVLATLRSLHRHLGADIPPVRISTSTTIPRSVGLAGSSAIVIATMRALITTFPSAEWATTLRHDHPLQAAVALDAETRELGIAAGLQDRVVQCFGEAMLMDFSQTTSLAPGLTAGAYRPLPRVPGVVFVATRPATAEPSGVAHGSLRDDFEAGRGDVRRTMIEIADHAHAAARAIERQDVAALGAAMDATLDARQSMMVLDPRHLAMADAVRSRGGHANWSGSGGSITVAAPNAAVADDARNALVDELGCTVIEVSDSDSAHR